MKLNLNSKEILALHNLLYDRFDSRHAHDMVDDPSAASDETQLRQVYNRLRALLIGALTNKATDPLEAWMGHEQAKIDGLKSDLDQVKQEQADLARKGPVLPEDFLEGNDDYDKREYPRRPPSPHMPKPKHHRGKR